MNYENFYEDLQPIQKSTKDSLASLQKLFKAVGKDVENGDMKNLSRNLESMAQAAAALSSYVDSMKETVNGFDTKSYFESGEFASQMLELCQEKGVDVQGESPIYEMFPYRVRIDAENQDLYLDRKKVQCMRPRSFVELVHAGQEKLNKAPFKPEIFASELADAYDTAALKMGKHAGADIYLSTLYKFLAPMSRFRKEYDQQSFAFDLARLYISRQEETKTGRQFQFGPCRNEKKAIRILDQNGQEQFLSTICFY